VLLSWYAGAVFLFVALCSIYGGPKVLSFKEREDSKL